MRFRTGSTRGSRRAPTAGSSRCAPPSPTGLYVGGYAWVENLKADARPDSEGYLLAPSQAQAATAAILRSGFMANHEQGAFDIALDSKRTRRAIDLLQGLTRDQPLAALYGYRIERGLRDALLGKFIWPLRLAYPWRPVGSRAVRRRNRSHRRTRRRRRRRAAGRLGNRARQCRSRNSTARIGR